MIDFYQTEEEIFDLVVDHSVFSKKHNIIARDNISGILISTSKIDNMPFNFETVIADGWGIYPIQRYDTKEDALKGHKEWTEKMPITEEIICLGYGTRGPMKINIARSN